MSTRVKICGVRTLQEAVFSIEAGADLLGINLIESSVRYLPPPTARALVASIRERFGRERVDLVGVVADQSEAELLALLRATGLDMLQLHGAEPQELVAALAGRAYKAVAIAEPGDVERARTFAGARVLVDAKVPGQLGGTGVRFDWGLLGALPRERDLLLAGGLDADNVAQAVAAVRPWGVDVASGVESAPGHKDPARVARFIERAKAV
jgi:phosphoribosylanthranilate isomerase